MSHDPQEPLPYATPQHQANGLPLGVQALLGTIITAALLSGAVVAGVFIGGTVGGGSDRAVFVGLAVVPGSMVVAAFVIARLFRRNPLSRGWAIGIYIGLGLGGLFWGVCGALLISLSSVH